MNKRILTDDAYQNGAASNQSHASTPADLAAALRNVGARARKSVTEGYATNRYHPSTPTLQPSSHGGHLFRSANDTLREVYSSPHLRLSDSSLSKKRTRPELDKNNPDEERNAHSDTEMDVEPTASNPTNDPCGRVVKPLRKPRARALMQTRSLPTDAFQFSGGSLTGTLNTPSLSTVREAHADDDWSVEAFHSSGIPPIEPTSLE